MWKPNSACFIPNNERKAKPRPSYIKGITFAGQDMSDAFTESIAYVDNKILDHMRVLHDEPRAGGIYRPNALVTKMMQQ